MSALKETFAKKFDACEARWLVATLIPRPIPATTTTATATTERDLDTRMTETYPIQAKLEAALGAERADRLLTELDNYSNQPNAVKGAAKRPSDPELEEVAHAVFAAATPEEVDLELDSIGMWGLLTLAARADVTILDSLPAPRVDNPKVASIRRAAAKHRKGLAE